MGAAGEGGTHGAGGQVDDRMIRGSPAGTGVRWLFGQSN